MTSRRLWIFFFLVTLPFLLMVVVNVSMGTPSSTYNATQCTRYCHDHGCAHVTVAIEGPVSTPFFRLARKLYVANIRWLHHNPFGMSYKEINLVIYVLILPLLGLVFLWGILRKRGRNV